jgi:hypothetical protein
MNVRNVIGGTLVVAVLVLLGVVGWQTAVNNSRINTLDTSIGRLSDGMPRRHDVDEAAKGWVTQKDFDELRKRFEAADMRAANDRLKIADCSASQAANSSKLATLAGDLAANIAATDELRVIIRQIVTKGSAGNSIVYLGDPQVKDQIRQLARETTPPPMPQPQSPDPWGTLQIDNRTPNPQRVQVNGIDFLVDPLSRHDVNVPAGPVTTRLVEFEGAQSWVVAPNHVKILKIERP